MMITILHGDHEIKISEEVFKLIQTAQSNNVEVVRLNAKKITTGDLETALGMDALFASKKAVFIDGLFSLPRSKFKDSLIAWIKEHDSLETDLYLIEKKALTATQLKSLPTAKQQVFKYPALLFSWLENIGVVPSANSMETLHKILEREEEQFVFIMLIRQVRTLIAFVFDGVYEGPPFLRAKVASQARHFSKEKLLAFHSQLLDLDEKQKSSQLTMSLTANLDLILALV